MVLFYHFLSFPDFPLELNIEGGKYHLMYGTGQTVTKKSGKGSVTKDSIILDGKKHLLAKLNTSVIYFTGYQFVFARDLYSINDFVVDEICSGLTYLPPNIDDLNFMKELKITDGRWLNLPSDTEETLTVDNSICKMHSHPAKWEELKRETRKNL